MSDTLSKAANWYEATQAASPSRPRLSFDLDVDVCVIGAGLAGLTVAREVAQRGWSVAVLEAGAVAGAASGRNTGFVLPGFADDLDAMVERIGLDHTRQLWALSEQGVDYVRQTIEGAAMPGVDPVPGWLHVSQRDNEEDMRGEVERLRWIGADVEFWPVARVREQLVNPRYFNAVHYRRAFHIHPLNYVLGLAALAEAAGARIFEQTPAVSLDAAGVRKRIDTPEGRVRAAHVVLAGNVQLGPLMPDVSATLLPIHTFVMVTEPLGPQVHDLIRYRGAVSDTDRADNHYRIVGEAGAERLMWSGRMRVWPADPRWIGRGLAADIKRNFPALGPVSIAHLWRGTLGRTIHRMPQIGELGRGVWLTSGFGGHGLNTTAMAGDLVARGIVDGDQTWRLFAPYELVWAGGALGSIMAQGVYWGTRPLDRLAQSLSRSREKARARRKARQDARQQRREQARARTDIVAPMDTVAPMRDPSVVPVAVAEAVPPEAVAQPDAAVAPATPHTAPVVSAAESAPVAGPAAPAAETAAPAKRGKSGKLSSTTSGTPSPSKPRNPRKPRKGGPAAGEGA